MIPSVLTFDEPQAGISTERAIKNVIQILEQQVVVTNEAEEDRLQVAIDDMKLMLGAIK